MSATIELMNASGEQDVPDEGDFIRWSDAVLARLGRQKDALELGIRLVDAGESAELNRHYRHKQGPTNVLSFAYTDFPRTGAHELLGDLAICAQVVREEALQQDKELKAHWAHMTVHGLLHLLGYDHQTDAEAEAMESLECGILAHLGYANPYQPR